MEKDRISTFLVKMPVWKICSYLHVYLLFLFAMTIINIYLLMKSLWPNEQPIIKVILKYLINKWRQKKLYTAKTKNFVKYRNINSISRIILSCQILAHTLYKFNDNYLHYCSHIKVKPGVWDFFFGYKQHAIKNKYLC